MEKFLSLVHFVGLGSFFKVILHVMLRKLDKRIKDYPVEFYQLSNYIFRQKGSITKSNQYIKVELPFLKYRPVFNIRKGASDAHVLMQIFERLEYQPLVTLVNNFPAIEINTIIDAGANAGFTSVFFNLQFPQARIISIEPDPENFLVLERNLLVNGVPGLALKKAIWGAEEKLKITKDFRDHREWSRQIEKVKVDGTEENAIEGITLDGVLALEKWTEIDILKIDIEGAEQYVFADPTAAQTILSKVKFIAIELHDEITFRVQFENYLKQAGFIYTNTGESLIGFNLKIVQI